jgi:outer membrane murein-binding lipoprotein Lpp
MEIWEYINLSELGLAGALVLIAWRLTPVFLASIEAGRERTQAHERQTDVMANLATRIDGDTAATAALATASRELCSLVERLKTDWDSARVAMTAASEQTRKHLELIHADVKVVPAQTLHLAEPKLTELQSSLLAAMSEVQQRILERLPEDATGAMDAVRAEMAAIRTTTLQRLAEIDAQLQRFAPEKEEVKRE